jgi:hypothetical protein
MKKQRRSDEKNLRKSQLLWPEAAFDCLAGWGSEGEFSGGVMYGFWIGRFNSAYALLKRAKENQRMVYFHNVNYTSV